MRLASPAFSASRMYDGWPEERALAWASAAPRHSALSFASPLSYVAYKDMPSSYILTERDGIIPPAVQEMYIDNIKTLTGKPVDVHKLDTNHAPNLTAPEDLAKVIVEIAAAS
jgi:pimeloyl-ACP methyl ester carboxylesterase